MPTLPPAIHVFERGWLSSNNILITGCDDATLVLARAARVDGDTLVDA
jgi:hypothetical protein